jgi:hypothetical protein
MKKVKLVDLAAEHGVENLRIFFPARRRDGFLGMVVISESNPAVVVEGRVLQTARPNRMVADDYKFIANPLDEAYAYEDYYNADFEGLSQQYPDRFYVMVGDEKFVLGFPRTEKAA